MIMSLVEASRAIMPRGRSRRTFAMRSGWYARTQPISSMPIMGPLLVLHVVELSDGCAGKDRLNLVRAGHGRGTLEPRGNDRPGRIRPGDDAFERPAAEQAVAQGPSEGIAGTQPVDDVDRNRGYHDTLVAGLGQRPHGTLLDDGDLDAGLEQCVGRPVRLGLADGDLALLTVAHRDGELTETLADLLSRLPGTGPEHRAVVEVEDRMPGPVPRRERGAG